MARKQAKITTITEAAADRFNASAEEGDTLSCELIPGFLLRKLPKNSAWRYRYTDASGKRRVATIGKYPKLKPADAAALALDLWQTGADPLAQKQAKREQAQEAAREADRRILDTYLHGEYSRSTMDLWAPKNKAANLRRFTTLLSDFLDRDMGSLNKHDVNEWQTRLEQRGLAHSSIKRAWSALRALLNQAVADDILDTNPLQGHRLRPPPYAQQQTQLEDPEKGKRRLLTPKEVQGILAGLDLFAEEIRQQRRSSRKNGKPHLPDLDLVAYPHWFIPFCKLAMATGWRPGDLYALRWDEVDLKFSGKLRKYAEKSKDVAARRGKDATLLETPLPQSAKAMLQEWHKQQGKPSAGLVFPSPRGGGQMANTAHLKPWRRAKELGGVNEALQFYALRHHAISAMVAAGVPLLTVAKLVGHKDASMIQKHYAHLCPDSAATALDIVAATIDKAGQSRRAAL